MIQTNNIDKQEKKFKETIIKTYKMDSIDTQDFIDKTLAEIKLSGILDNSHNYFYIIFQTSIYMFFLHHQR